MCAAKACEHVYSASAVSGPMRALAGVKQRWSCRVHGGGRRTRQSRRRPCTWPCWPPWAGWGCRSTCGLRRRISRICYDRARARAVGQRGRSQRVWCIRSAGALHLQEWSIRVEQRQSRGAKEVGSREPGRHRVMVQRAGRGCGKWQRRSECDGLAGWPGRARVRAKATGWLKPF